MPRKRYVQQSDGQLVEVSLDWMAEPRQACNYVVGDRHYDGLRSPVDGANISSRVKHREYLYKTGLATADDFRGTWKDSAKARADYFEGRDPSRYHDVEKAVHKLETRRK